MASRTIVVLLVLMAGFAITSRAATAEDGAELRPPTALCTDTSAMMRFSWEPMERSILQWVDLSTLDNGFANGFAGAGPFYRQQSSMSWNGILPGIPHYWRVNTLIETGWVVSETGVFVACSPAVLLWGPATCEEDGTVSVDFRWAPSTAAGIQWLDVSANGDGFDFGSFETSGPLLAGVHSYYWQGLEPETLYHFRVNGLTARGWSPSITASFSVSCV